MKPSELNIDGTLQFASTQYEIALNGSEAFIAGSTDPVTITLGQLDPTLEAQTMEAIGGGLVDEVELHVTPARMTSVVRGRDAAANAVDGNVWVLYALVAPDPPVPPDPPVEPPPPPPGWDFPPLTDIPGVTVPVVVIGVVLASAIAADLCTRVGLTCSWGAPDYTMREDFEVKGTVLGGVQQLVEPFNHFEPSKVDVYLNGTVLVVRQRGGEAAGAIAMNVHDARITSFMIRRHFLGYIRVLSLFSSAAAADSAGGPPNICPPGVYVFSTSESDTEDEVSDDTHGVVSRLSVHTVQRDFDNAVLSQISTVEKWDGAASPPGLRTLSVSTTTNGWPSLPILIGADGVQSVPYVPPMENSITNAVKYDSKGNGTSIRTSIYPKYDSTGYKISDTTVIETFPPDKPSTTRTEVKTYRKNGLQMTEITSLRNDGSLRKTSANGTPPGGPGRGTVILSGVCGLGDDPGGGTGGGGEGSSLAFAVLISSEITAKDVSMSNNNLRLADLNLIAAQALAASGSTETEISFTAANIPWLNRGDYLALTGLENEAGDPIPLSTALITEAKHEYRENGPNPTSLTHVRASYWTK